MADADLGALLGPHKNTLKDMAQSLATGDHAKLAASAAVLVGAVATGHPEVALLAPFAEKAIAAAFGRSADAMLRREFAAMEKEEERQRFVADLAEPVEALVGQAVIQLVRVQHNVKDEVLEALGGVREDLAGFRDAFAKELGSATVKVDVQAVKGGAVGVRVRSETKNRVFIGHMEVSGPGSVGIDLG
ncbi:hypothetical protein WMF38_20765 [Sorangium sp. So ce118]